MRRIAISLLLSALVFIPSRCGATTLEQVVTHEGPWLVPREARFAVGRDGHVYLASLGKTGGGLYGFVLRMDRDGKDKIGAAVVPYAYNATANKDGTLATANPPVGRSINLHDPAFHPFAKVDDFPEGDHSPVHVEAGASDFYALDAHRRQVVRISPTAKLLKTYSLPRGEPMEGRWYWDFRVCEKAEAFYLLVRESDPPRTFGAFHVLCVGFDGKLRWAYQGLTSVQELAIGYTGAFDADDDGNLFVMPPGSEVVKKFAPDGKPLADVRLRMGDARPRPGEPWFTALQVHGSNLFLKRSHDTELFQRYDLASGERAQVVHTDHERLTVTFEGDVWTAGRPVPVRIKLTGSSPLSPWGRGARGEGDRTLSPRWRAWARPFASLDYRELPLRDGAIQVPEDAAGLYLVKFTPEVAPWQRGSPADYLVRAVVEVRRPDTKGSATVLTPANRSHYGRGEEVPFTVALRGAGAEAVKLTVHLRDDKGVVARAEAESRNTEVVTFKLPSTLTAALRPGRYTLAVSAPGLSCAGQPLVIGPGLRKSPFSIVQHADFDQLYPCPDVWDAPDLTVAHAARTAKLGATLLIDRIGWGAQLNNVEGPRLTWDRSNQEELEALARRLQAGPGGVAPGRAALAAPLPLTQAAYSAAGIEQMASLVSMDAGLPLGSPYDQRKPDEFKRDLTRVTEVLRPYPSFRGWMWAANWWVWEDRPGNDPRNRRAKEAKTPEERAAYLAAFEQAQKTGAWSPVLGKVADYRLGYAIEAQELFNTTLKKIAPDKVTAVAGPYRSLDVYPPTTFSNVDEVSLHYQAEQLQWPHIAPHDVDYQKRPGKRAWGHPELQNDAGTGDQALPALFQMVMRGADGVGCSGAIPNWGPQPEDARSSYQGTTSIHRAAYALLRQYGPWLTTLRNNDRVAIVVSGRMVRVDDWGGIGGAYFTRLFEAYQSCLRAHHPASFVFVEDLKPDTLKAYKAVLVVGQTVEMEPELVAALDRAKATGTAIFHDDTCRKELVKEWVPLRIAFNKVNSDPSVWQDDSAYLRFPGHYRAHLPALTKALRAVVPPVAEVDGDEVLLSERAAEDGRYLFVVNDTVPDLGPGQLWRVTLAIASRMPVKLPVKRRDPGTVIYDVFAHQRVEPRDGTLEADLRCLPARVYAILPAAIARVELRGPKRADPGQAFGWSAEAQDGDGKPLQASVPLRVRLLDAEGSVLDELFTAAGSKGAKGTMRLALNAAPGAQVLEATELFSGQMARLSIAALAPGGPLSLAEVKEQHEAPADTTARGAGANKDLATPEGLFGPHVRDLVVADEGKLAVASAMNWDHNLYALDLATGAVRWRQRAGHYFAFSPQAFAAGVAVQGYDLKSAEGYHLYLVGGDGKLARRFALYGLPRRLPHRFVPGLFLSDHVNNFAVPHDGGWVAAAGDLGLAVWSKGGKLLWSQDWWKAERHTAALAALGADTLLVVEGMTATAYAAGTGERRWQVRLAPDGEVTKVTVAADGKTCGIEGGGGRIYILGAGRVLAVLHGEASGRNLRHLALTGQGVTLGITGIALSPDGSLVAVTAGNLLKLYSVRDGLRWLLPADDTLHAPRFSTDGKRIAAGSELGSLYVLDTQGAVLLERDLGALPVPAWLPDGDLLVGTWMGTVCRLDGKYSERWRTRLQPAAADMRGKLLADDGTTTTRVAFRGNAEATPAPLAPNLLGPKSAFIKLVWRNLNGDVDNSVLLTNDSSTLMDGKPDAPPVPWIGWPQMNWYAEGSPSTSLLIDTYRTQLRVTGITLAEGPDHPESWLRDAAFEYWDAAGERWVFVQPLLSDAAVHTHKFARPIEAARFRIVLPKMLCGNLRLGEVVLHGEKLGPSHPDVIAKRPVAVLFDEGNDLKGYFLRSTIALKGAYSGERCLTIGAEDGYSLAPWPEGSNVFGQTLPGWDFPIVEGPVPGEYRYLQFAWKALAENTRTIALRLDGEPANTYTVTLFAGESPSWSPLNPRKVADPVPREWKVVRVDLWEVFKKPVRIRGMQLSAPGGSAAFDQVLLGRSEKDLPPIKK
jgi:outer membrane protein assembly factor BamB